MPKKKKRGVDDLSKWRIKMLAAYAGFSRQSIASRVGVSLNQVSHVLKTEAIRVKDWRDMVSNQSKRHADAITKAGYLRTTSRRKTKKVRKAKVA